MSFHSSLQFTVNIDNVTDLTLTFLSMKFQVQFLRHVLYRNLSSSFSVFSLEKSGKCNLKNVAWLVPDEREDNVVQTFVKRFICFFHAHVNGWNQKTSLPSFAFFCPHPLLILFSSLMTSFSSSLVFLSFIHSSLLLLSFLSARGSLVKYKRIGRYLFESVNSLQS